MAVDEPLYVVYAHPVVHLGAYAGLAALAVAGFAGFFVHYGIGLALLAASALGFLMIEMVRRADRLAFYKDGVAREYKLFSTKRTFAEYESVQDVEMTQGIIDRIVGVGTLHINTSGSHGQEIVFAGITNCHDVEQVLREKMRPAQAPQVDTSEAGNVR